MSMSTTARTLSRSLARATRPFASHPERLSTATTTTSSIRRSNLSAAAAYEQDDYVSPMKDLFDNMHSAGPTTLGTTEFVPVNTKFLKCGVAESALRFTTTAYGRLSDAPFVHPSEHRVILQVSTDKLPLSPQEQDILKEIVGSRWNEERQELRLQSTQFGSRIENKRHLVSMLDRIVLSCQRLALEMQELPASETHEKI